MGFFAAKSPITPEVRRRLAWAIDFVNNTIPHDRQPQVGQLSGQLIDPLWTGNSRLGMSDIRMSLQGEAMIATAAWLALLLSRKCTVDKDAITKLGEAFAVMEFGNYLNRHNLTAWSCSMIVSPRILPTITMIVDVAYGSRDIKNARSIIEQSRFVGGLCAFGSPERAKLSLDDSAAFLDSIRSTGAQEKCNNSTVNVSQSDNGNDDIEEDEDTEEEVETETDDTPVKRTQQPSEFPGCSNRDSEASWWPCVDMFSKIFIEIIMRIEENSSLPDAQLKSLRIALIVVFAVYEREVNDLPSMRWNTFRRSIENAMIGIRKPGQMPHLEMKESGGTKVLTDFGSSYMSELSHIEKMYRRASSGNTKDVQDIVSCFVRADDDLKIAIHHAVLHSRAHIIPKIVNM